MAGLLAKHFQGALPFRDILDMTSRDLQFYLRIYERQAVEEEIANEYLKNKKDIPSPVQMRKLVNERLKK